MNKSGNLNGVPQDYLGEVMVMVMVSVNPNLVDSLHRMLRPLGWAVLKSWDIRLSLATQLSKHHVRRTGPRPHGVSKVFQ